MFAGLDEYTEFGKVLQEQEFTFTPGLAPVNHASFGAVPRRIQGIQNRFLKEMNSHPDMWFKQSSFKYWTQSVDAVSRFLNCSPKDLVFVTNVTEGINTILMSCEFMEGESILSTSLTYNSVSVTCKEVAAKSKSAKSTILNLVLPILNKDDVVKQYEDYIKSNPKTKIAVIDHISSPSGILMPVKEIATLCRKYGILTLVDGAHAPGQIPVDINDLDVDFYTGSLHKWLFTPRGCAVLYVNRKHHDWVKPLVTSRWADKSFGEQFFQCGTRDHIPFICAKYALEFCEKIGGMNRMLRYTSQLASDALEYLVGVFQTGKLEIPTDMEAPNIKLILLPEMKGSLTEVDLMSFRVNLWRRYQIKTVAVNIQGRCYLRLSSSIYNYMDEYRKLGDAVLQYIEERNDNLGIPTAGKLINREFELWFMKMDMSMVLEGLNHNTELGKPLQEKEFTFTPGLAPLNHGSYGAVPRRIQDIQKRFLVEMNAHPDLWFRGNDIKYLKESRDAAARFFNCEPQDLVFVTNATEGVNTVLKSCDFKEGESILSTSETYGAISLTCKDVAAKNKVIRSEVLDIQFPIASEDEILRRYEEHLKSHPKTRIAVIDHITSSSGILMPVKKLSQVCHRYGVLVLIDGAHAPGQIPLDFEELDVDFYTGNFHKWLFTPRGCAVLYVKRKHHDWVKPLVTSWSADKPFGERFLKVGTCDQIPHMCAKYALEFYDKLGGMYRMSSYTSKLANEAQQYLVDLFKTEKLGIPKEMEAPNIKLVLLPDIKRKVHLQDFFMTLFKRTKIQTVCVEIQGGNYLRLSAAIYNYIEEYKRLGDAVLEYITEINNQTETDTQHG